LLEVGSRDDLSLGTDGDDRDRHRASVPLDRHPTGDFCDDSRGARVGVVPPTDGIITRWLVQRTQRGSEAASHHNRQDDYGSFEGGAGSAIAATHS
jgi:hypothetical protein